MTNYFQSLIISNKLYLNFKELNSKVENYIFSHTFQELNGKAHQVTIWCNPLPKTQQSFLLQWCLTNTNSLNNKVLLYSYIRENNFLPQITDFAFNCSCGHSGLCKHALFSFFTLGEKFKTDARLLLNMRRINVDEMISTVANQVTNCFINKINNAPKERIVDDSIFDKILMIDEN